MIVSPTLVSATSLIPAHTYPTSPVRNPGRLVAFGVNAPTSLTSKSFRLDIIWIFMPWRSAPSMTRVSRFTP